MEGLRPLSGIVLLLLLWEVAAQTSEAFAIPGPWTAFLGVIELAVSGKLLRYVVASLFRVMWGFGLALIVGVPFGIVLGWYPRVERAVGPLLQLFRPISPIAWIPIAILWFGVGDLAAIMIIFQACFGPLTVTAMNAVRKVPAVQIRAGRNFGLSGLRLMRHVVVPSAAPQLLVGVRQALYVAWAVVVMAEMIAVSSGLGFLIVEARNAGDRFDLILAGMAMIGIVGVLLDKGIQAIEDLPGLRWGFAQPSPTASASATERESALAGRAS